MLYWWLGRRTWWIKGGRLYSIHGCNTLLELAWLFSSMKKKWKKSKCVHYSCKQNIIFIWPRQMNFVLAVPWIGMPQLKGNSQNCDFLIIGISFFFSVFFHWFCSITTHISSKFLAQSRLIIIMFRPLDKND